MQTEELSSRIEEQRPFLEAFLARHGGTALRYEGVDDLIQCVHLRAIEVAESFRWQGDAALRSWLSETARQVISARHVYWTALKRDAGILLRANWGTASSDFSARNIESPHTGPSTFAMRREMLRVAVLATATLQPRDRKIVALGPNVSSEDLSHALGSDPEAARRARSRAYERFERAFRVLCEFSERPGAGR